MSDFKAIYSSHEGAERYDLLVSREDYQGNLLRAIRQIHPLSNSRLAEMGAGTGRITTQLAPFADHLYVYDNAPAMLALAKAKIADSYYRNCTFDLADNNALPLADASVDVCLAGWSIGHNVGWYPDQWQAQVASVLAEMRRVTKPQGSFIIIETLGTGHQQPTPPPSLHGYYAMLNQAGFAQTSIRTDYQFDSLAEAEALASFFFGEDLALQVRQNQWQILPECTGIWWQTR
jgi:ubiquinone/menaquinone biosynthesis C-methylase UbiE